VKSGFVRLRTVSTVSAAGYGKPLKPFFRWWRFHTQLKQGVNDMEAAKAGKV